MKHTLLRAGAVAVLALGLSLTAGCVTPGAQTAALDPPARPAGDSGIRQVSATDEQPKAGETVTDWTDYSIQNGLGLIPLPKLPPPPAESLVLTKQGLAPDQLTNTANPRLVAARDYFRRSEFSSAEALYHRVAENKRNPIAEVAEARYYEAECLRLQARYPRAADTYVALLKTLPQNPYREQAIQHMYDIANYWLEDTRDSMREAREVREGRRWFSTPRWLHFGSTKPVLDEEGRALEKLEQVRLYDINGPLADKALFLCGTVKFFNEDYRDADHFFSQIYECHPNSPLAAKAVELAIVSKHLSTGGSDYDGRKVAEARKLVHAALSAYPELANDPSKRAKLVEQLDNISYQQSEKSFKMGEYYERTGHEQSAYFYYKLVTQQYPGTKYAELSAQKVAAIEAKLEKNGSPLPEPQQQPQQPKSSYRPLDRGDSPRNLPPDVMR